MLKIKTDYNLAYAIERAYKRLFYTVILVGVLVGLGLSLMWGAEHHPYATLGIILGFVVFTGLLWFLRSCQPSNDEEFNDPNSPYNRDRNQYYKERRL